MSSISAGTSSGTALVQSGDTTGALVIKTGGSAATAATFNADQTVTLAAPLPVASGGTGATSLSGITVGTATSATTATNLAGGSGGTIPYQTSSGATSMLAAGTSGYLLQSNGTSAPSWTPAPASAGTVTAVASGSLSNGSMVILNSNGTVSVPVATAQDAFQNVSSGSSATVSGYAPLDNNYRNTSACFNPNTSTVVVFFIDNTNNYLNAIAGIVNKGVINFGTPVRIYSSALVTGGSTGGLHAAYDSINNRYFCLFRYSGSGYGSFGWCKTSGTTITDVSTSVDSWGGSNPAGFTLIISPTLNGSNTQALIYYNAGATGSSYVIACTCSTTPNYLTIGTQYDLSAGAGTTQMLGCFGATPNIAVVPYRGASGTVFMAVVTLNGTSATLSYQGQMSSNASSGYPMAIAYSVAQNKFMGLWTSSSFMRGSIFTLSGTTPTFGATTILGGYGTSTQNTNLVVDEATGYFWAGQTIYLTLVTVTGTTFTSGNVNQFSQPVFSNYVGNVIYDNVNLAFLQPNLSNPASLNYAQGFTSTMTANNFLGVSSAAYTNGQTATIQTVGSTDDAQSGLTIGNKYYVLPSGSLSSTASTQPYAGLALTATNLVVKG